MYVCDLNIHVSTKMTLIHVIYPPCTAELFQLYFSSFEAGIADAISSYKLQ